MASPKAVRLRARPVWSYLALRLSRDKILGKILTDVRARAAELSGGSVARNPLRKVVCRIDARFYKTTLLRAHRPAWKDLARYGLVNQRHLPPVVISKPTIAASWPYPLSSGLMPNVTMVQSGGISPELHTSRECGVLKNDMVGRMLQTELVPQAIRAATAFAGAVLRPHRFEHYRLRFGANLPCLFCNKEPVIAIDKDYDWSKQSATAGFHFQTLKN